MSDNTCPFKIITRTDPPVPLLPSSNTANLKRIVFNIHNSVLLRLLVCREENKTQIPNNCPYPEHKNSDAVNFACTSPNKLAHVYLRHEQMDDTARSCIIIFIEAMYLFTQDGLLKLFQDTVNWLNIAQEKPYFYVIPCYGKQQASVHTAFNSKILNMELRKVYKGYSNDEDICIVIPADIRAEILNIDHIGGSKKFKISPH